jgi:hypothetical protein
VSDDAAQAAQSLYPPISEYSVLNATFANFQTTDFLIRNNQYKVDSVGEKIDAKKFESVGKLPPVLMRESGRFTYD